MRWHFFALFFIPLLVLVSAGADFYKILGVSKDATDKELKRAYRQLSKKYHPDKNPGDESAEQKFVEIAQAYETLSDPEQRQIYDTYGEEGLKNGGGGGGGGHGGGDPFEMFARFFGGQGPFGGGGRGGVKRGPDKQVIVKITLEEIYLGTTATFTLDMQGICDACSGTGSADKERITCQRCQGHGMLIQQIQLAPGFVQNIQQTCPDCGGKGTQIAHKCKLCNGVGIQRESRKFEIEIQPGVAEGERLIYEGESDESPEWEAGNLIVEIQEDLNNGNKGYRRRGSQLFRTEVLSLKEALLGGWSRKVAFFGKGATINLQRGDGIPVQPGEIEIIKGKGMPIDQKYGDLIIEYKVVFPGTKAAASKAAKLLVQRDEL